MKTKKKQRWANGVVDLKKKSKASAGGSRSST
jgi:hypothetical protein